MSQAAGLLWLFLAAAATSQAETLDQEYLFRQLGHGDRAYIDQQQAAIAEIAARRYGDRFSGDIARDLKLLQRLLDDKIIKPDERRKLQAMGVVLGNLLAAKHELEWTIYIDKLGRSRALRIDNTSQALFPTTMISRRYSVDAKVDLEKIVARVARTVKRVRDNAALY